MEQNNTEYCNVCLTSSKDDPKRVYVKAICGGEEVHICTSCMPQVIHGSGDIVNSNEEVKAKVS
jgi:hypothetical protein